MLSADDIFSSKSVSIEILYDSLPSIAFSRYCINVTFIRLVILAATSKGTSKAERRDARRHLKINLSDTKDGCSLRGEPLRFLFFFRSFFNRKMQQRRDGPTNESCAGDSQVLESIIYVDPNGTCLLDLDPGWGRGATAGTRERSWTIPYISRGRFMEIRSGRPSRYNDRWSRYDRDRGTCALCVFSATFLESHAEAMRCGSLAMTPLNMEESRRIAIRRVRSGLRENVVVM